MGRGRTSAIVLAAGAMVVLIATAGDALVAQLTKLPLGRGTTAITWKGARGLSPTINSIKGTARGYQVAATGRVPETSPTSGTASALPSQYPIADVQGTIGGTGFTLNIVLTLPASLTSSKLQTFGRVTGTFRNQRVAATLTANVNSSSFTFVGTIGSLHIAGHVSQPKQPKCRSLAPTPAIGAGSQTDGSDSCRASDRADGTSIHRDHCSRDVRRGGREQEGGDSAELFWFPVST
jgi:hypothetical protein